VRITNLYGTTWEPVDHLDGDAALTGYLRFGRLETYYRKAAEQLPAVAARELLDVPTMSFNRWQPETRLKAGRLWILVMPSGQAVVALTLDVECPLLATIDLLEDCYYFDVKVDGVPLEHFVCQVVAGLGMDDADGQGFAPERHQIVFSRQLPPGGRDDDDVIQRLVYRADLPYRREFSAITYPAELNRRPGASVAVGPYVSVMCGQQDYVENAAFVSAAQAVASSVRLREVRDLAYDDVRIFRDAQSEAQSLHTRRHTLERMASQLGNLELELSYSVESSADLGLLVPSLRVVGYHDALYDCMSLREEADTVGRMLQRLEHSIRAELTSIESMERRADENRRMRWTVAIGFLSTVAVPLTLVLTFFGVNAREVDNQLSMFDTSYWPMYAIIAGILALGLSLSIGLYVQQERQARRDAAHAAQVMAAVRSMSMVNRRLARPQPTGPPRLPGPRLAASETRLI
jgi:hypothetical protein